MTEKKPQLQRKALRTRERARNKKPVFLRPESWRDTKFSESWRRPRGLDNKIRQKVKGWPAAPSTGYKGPNFARGLHPSGYREVIVYNTEDVAAVDSSTQAIRIAHTVGKRKRDLIIAEAEKLQVKVLNAPFVEESIDAEVEQEIDGTSFDEFDENEEETAEAGEGKSSDEESEEEKE